MSKQFSLFTSELEPIQNSAVSLNDILPGLMRISKFSALTYAENSPFIMLAEIEDLKRIKTYDIQHTYTG